MNITPSRVTKTLVAGLIASVAMTALLAAPAAAADPVPSLSGDRGLVAAVDGEMRAAADYAITMKVTNNSGRTLYYTPGSDRLGNGSTWASPIPEQIAPGTTAEFTAKNSGNGVHIWIRFADEAGNGVELEANVPKVNPNWKYWFSYNPAGKSGSKLSDLKVGSSGIGSGKKPQASFTINSCSGGCADYNDKYKGGPAVLAE